MKIVTNGTRLMVTATDTAVLCGAEAKACARLYDAKPVHNEVCHEGGMRIMIGYIARVAAQFGIGVDVDLSVSYMHYMRCFLKLSIGAEKAQETISKMGYLKYCDGCGAFGTEVGFVPKELKCANCGKQMAAYGRMWFGRLKDQKIVDSLYKSIDDDEEKEAKKLLEVIKSEIETPFYYHIPTLTKRCKMGSVSPYAVASNLKRGHRVSFTHMKDSAIKTDASIGGGHLGDKGLQNLDLYNLNAFYVGVIHAKRFQETGPGTGKGKGGDYVGGDLGPGKDSPHTF